MTSPGPELTSTGKVSSYEQKKAALVKLWINDTGQLRLAKSTISNLFRYKGRGAAARRQSLGDFDEVMSLDSERQTHARRRRSRDVRDYRRVVPAAARLPSPATWPTNS